MNSDLSVRLYKSMNIPGVAENGEVTPGNGDRFIDVEVAYTPSTCSKITEEERLKRENFDREWFAALVKLNPTIDNLSVAVNSAAKALIDMVHPESVSMSVTLSGSADKNGFCTKTVQFYWDKENA
jgi:hypothetical protein